MTFRELTELLNDSQVRFKLTHWLVNEKAYFKPKSDSVARSS